MQPRLDDANIEFDFTPTEKISARILDAVKIAWLQTKYSQLWKKRNSTPASESVETDRSYFLQIAELDGRLSMIQELLDDHKAAMQELSDKPPTDGTVEKNDASVTARASKLVHIPSA
jgi:hypothetical protein